MPRHQPNNLLYALVNLSYVCSYIVFGKIYTSENYYGPVTLKKAISYDTSVPITGLRNVIKKFYMGNYDNEFDIPLSYFQKTEKWVKSEFSKTDIFVSV